MCRGNQLQWYDDLFLLFYFYRESKNHSEITPSRSAQDTDAVPYMQVPRCSKMVEVVVQGGSGEIQSCSTWDPA